MNGLAIRHPRAVLGPIVYCSHQAHGPIRRSSVRMLGGRYSRALLSFYRAQFNKWKIGISCLFCWDAWSGNILLRITIFPAQVRQTLGYFSVDTMLFITHDVSLVVQVGSSKMVSCTHWLLRERSLVEDMMKSRRRSR